MKYSRSVENGVVCESVNLERATYQDSEEFKKILFDDINAGNKKLVIDLCRCGFIDSTFVGIMLQALKKITDENGHLAVVACQDEVLSVIEYTGAKKVFDIYGNVDEAVGSFT